MSRRILSGIALLVLAAAGAAVVSCSSGEPKPGAQQTPPAASPATEQGPGATVQRFYTFLNQRRYADAKALYTAETLKIVDDPQMMGPGAFERWGQTETRMESVKNVSIVNTQESGDTATVQFEIAFGDGSKETKQVEMKLEGGNWKLGMVS